MSGLWFAVGMAAGLLIGVPVGAAMGFVCLYNVLNESEEQ